MLLRVLKWCIRQTCLHIAQFTTCIYILFWIEHFVKYQSAWCILGNIIWCTVFIVICKHIQLLSYYHQAPVFLACTRNLFSSFLQSKNSYSTEKKMHLILKNTNSLNMSIYRVFTFRKLNLNSIFDFSWGRLIDTRQCNTNLNLKTIM